MAEAAGNVVAVLALGAAFGGLMALGSACTLPFVRPQRRRGR
jgi:hypothetical protein